MRNFLLIGSLFAYKLIIYFLQEVNQSRCPYQISEAVDVVAALGVQEVGVGLQEEEVLEEATLIVVIGEDIEAEVEAMGTPEEDHPGNPYSKLYLVFM